MDRKKLLVFLFLLLSNDINCSKRDNITKKSKHVFEKNKKVKEKIDINRLKRSVFNDNYDKSIAHLNSKFVADDIDEDEKKSNFDIESPFWGTRGRRDGSEENSNVLSARNFGYEDCQNCYKSFNKFGELINRRDESPFPFWGNRGRRDSDEVNDLSSNHLFLGNKGRRQDNGPFWGMRGRRQEDEPFWGNRGRRYKGISNSEMKFSNEPRQRYDEVDDIEPFWGNRGRRVSPINSEHRELHEENVPFWGNRGRRETLEPFWASRGRRKEKIPITGNDESEPFWGNRGRRKTLKNSIINAINDVQNRIENFARPRENNDFLSSFWSKRTQDNQIKTLYTDNDKSKTGPHSINTILNYGLRFNPTEPNTVHDDRIYAEQPHYILVERSSRSSAEDDPFVITRGKKYVKGNLDQASRDRRGALEDIVKSVKNDPYYIARGKKISDNKKMGNATFLKKELEKAKDLICSTIDFLSTKNDFDKGKRQTGDNERDRRTILKKLAAQLQVDPYFVSRGKRTDNPAINEDNLVEFVNQVAMICD